MIKNVTIFFFAGIFLLGVIVGSVYGFAKIVDAATYKVNIPEVKTIELSQIENEIPIPTSIPSTKVTPAAPDNKVEESQAKPESKSQNLINNPTSTKNTHFEKDDDEEDVYEKDREEKENHGD